MLSYKGFAIGVIGASKPFVSLPLLALAVGVLAACAGADDSAAPPRQLVPLSIDSSIEQVVQRVHSAARNFSTLQGVIENDSFEGTFREAVWVRQPDRWRVEFSGDLNELGSLVSGDIVVSDGSRTWLIQPYAHRYCAGFPGGEFSEEVLSGSASSDWPPTGLDTGEVVGEETVAGRQALRIKRGPLFGGAEVWVDTLTGVVLRFEWPEETHTVSQGRYVEIVFDQRLDDALFSFQPEPEMKESPCEEIVNY